MEGSAGAQSSGCWGRGAQGKPTKKYTLMAPRQAPGEEGITQTWSCPLAVGNHCGRVEGA